MGMDLVMVRVMFVGYGYWLGFRLMVMVNGLGYG